MIAIGAVALSLSAWATAPSILNFHVAMMAEHQGAMPAAIVSGRHVGAARRAIDELNERRVPH